MRFCPQCRSADFLRTALNQYQCAECSYEYFHNAASAVAAIICVGNEVLFNQRAQEPAKGCLDLPGGFVDPNESLEQALHRELDEELGIKVPSLVYFGSYPNTYFYKTVNYFTCDVVFIAELAEKPDLNLQMNEVRACQWLAIADIEIAAIGFTSLATALKQFIAQRTSGVQPMDHR